MLYPRQHDYRFRLSKLNLCENHVRTKGFDSHGKVIHIAFILHRISHSIIASLLLPAKYDNLNHFFPAGIVIGEGPSRSGATTAADSRTPTGGGGISELKQHLQDSSSDGAANGKNAEDSGGGSNVPTAIIVEPGRASYAAGPNEEEEEEPIDMSFPSGQGWKKILIYIVSFPIMAPLYLTLPDTKKPDSKLFPHTLSLVFFFFFF